MTKPGPAAARLGGFGLRYRRLPPCGFGTAGFVPGIGAGVGGSKAIGHRLATAVGLGLCLSVALSACTPPPVPNPHYVLGKPYQSGAAWFYPKESFDLDETGIATISPSSAARLTADGEVFDQTALAAGHPTVQLPAIARITNLENGRAVVVRVNDRGAGDPHRLLEVTRRAAALLEMPAPGTARVRLQILPNESHAAADALPGAPSLAIAAAPRGAFEVAELPPPPGVRQGSGRTAATTVAASSVDKASNAPPMRLPEAVTQGAPRPGQLVVRLDTFDEYQYAAVQRARMAGTGAHIISTFEGKAHHFRVEVGPLPDLPHADAVLDQALRSGIPDARIVVD